MGPQYIIVSGIDGSGKTTLIDGLRNELHSRGKTTHYVWLRYNHVFVRPVHALCRLVGLSRKRQNGEGKVVWRHEFYRCHSFCSLYIFLTFFDVLLGRLRLWNTLRKTEADIIICDRWINDILIDLAVDTRRPNLLRNEWSSRFSSILPSNSRQYVINRNTLEVMKARPEYNHDREFVFRENLYRRLFSSANVKVVDNNNTIKKAIDSIIIDFETIK